MGEEDKVSSNEVEAADEPLEPFSGNWFERKAAEDIYADNYNAHKECYAEFRAEYSLDRMEALSKSDDFLEGFFLTGRNSGLCYELEYGEKYEEFGGAKGGGSVSKYYIRYVVSENAWEIARGRGSYERVSRDEALEEGRKICRALVSGGRAFEACMPKDEKDLDMGCYENLRSAWCGIRIDGKGVEDLFPKFWSMPWVLKYYHMIFPHLLPHLYDGTYVNPMLNFLGLKCDDDIIIRLGRINCFRTKKCPSVSNYVLCHIFYDLKGAFDISKFFRVDAGSEGVVNEWIKGARVDIGCDKISGLDEMYGAKKDEFEENKRRSAIVDALVEQCGFKRRDAKRRFSGGFESLFSAPPSVRNYFVATFDGTVAAIGEMTDRQPFKADGASGYRCRVKWLKKFKGGGAKIVADGDSPTSDVNFCPIASEKTTYPLFKSIYGVESEIVAKEEKSMSEYFTYKFCKYLDEYKKNLKNGWEDDSCRLEALKAFKDNWDENAEDFHSMLEKSLINKPILDSRHYRPRYEILRLAQKRPDDVKNMFVNLFAKSEGGDSSDFAERVTDFVAASDELFREYMRGEKSYQDFKSVSTYLWLRFPDKYFVYGQKCANAVLSAMKGCKIPSFGDRNGDPEHDATLLSNFHELYSTLKSRLCEDDELMSLYDDAIKKYKLKGNVSGSAENCYEDLEKVMLAMDVAYGFADFKYEPEIKEGSTSIFETGYKKAGMPLNLIVFGAPGTGKSYLVEKMRQDLLRDGGEYERVTFYPDYSYANFVGTYKPTPAKDEKGNDAITYEYVPGPFMRTLIKALKNGVESTKKPYLLIVEEINRANAAAVFGDVFQLLDRGKNGSNASDYPIQTSNDMRTYIARELDGDSGNPDDYPEIRIPDNMFIWATMNSADQGVYPLDTAFKRRWDFKYMGIDDNEKGLEGKKVRLGKDGGQVVEWNALRKAVNDCLAVNNINEDKQLGAYFIEGRDLFEVDPESGRSENFIETFKDKVLMYLFEDAGRQIRSKLFGERSRYSEICKKFDEDGIYVFRTIDCEKLIDNEERAGQPGHDPSEGSGR